MNKKVMAFAALGSAGLASICCIGPLVLAGLGAGSLGLAAWLSQYRPLFLGLTGALLAAAFHFVYRKRPVTCADGSCEQRSGGRNLKAGLWAATLLAAAMAAFPRWASLLLTGNRASIGPGAHTLSLKISGMNCAACTIAIKRSVEKVPGVISVDIDFAGRRAKVETALKADPQAVLKAVDEAGYKAELYNSGGTNGKT